MYFRVVDGQLTKGDVIKLMNTRKEYEVAEVGVLAPKPPPAETIDKPLRALIFDSRSAKRPWYS